VSRCRNSWPFCSARSMTRAGSSGLSGRHIRTRTRYGATMNDDLDARLPEDLERDLREEFGDRRVPPRPVTPRPVTPRPVTSRPTVSPVPVSGPDVAPTPALAGRSLLTPYTHLPPRAQLESFGSSVPDIAVRLDLQEGNRTQALSDLVLSDPRQMIEKACSLGPTDPAAASVWLAGALVAQAEREVDGRLRSFLVLLAPIVARSDAGLLLGPPGANLRQEVLPNGWTYTIESWHRMRYAWREGLVRLFHTTEGDRRVLQALDQLSRVSVGEADPVTVAIQESWPPKPWATVITLLGAALAAVGLSREYKRFR